MVGSMNRTSMLWSLVMVCGVTAGCGSGADSEPSPGSALVVRGDSLDQAGSFDNNTYFHPFVAETHTTDPRWPHFLVYHSVSDENTKYSLSAWREASGETNAQGAPMYWHVYATTPLVLTLSTIPTFCRVLMAG